MTWLDHICVARSDLGLSPVFVRDVKPAGLNDAHVPDLTAVRAYDRLNALRPLPTRRERHAGSGRAPHPDHIDARLVGRARLVRRVEIQRLNTSHTSSLNWGLRVGATLPPWNRAAPQSLSGASPSLLPCAKSGSARLNRGCTEFDRCPDSFLTTTHGSSNGCA